MNKLVYDIGAGIRDSYIINITRTTTITIPTLKTYTINLETFLLLILDEMPDKIENVNGRMITTNNTNTKN